MSGRRSSRSAGSRRARNRAAAPEDPGRGTGGDDRGSGAGGKRSGPFHDGLRALDRTRTARELRPGRAAEALRSAAPLLNRLNSSISSFVIPSERRGIYSRPDGYASCLRFAVYVLSNAKGTLYVGVTNDLRRRVFEHRHRLVPGFTRRYHVDRLVYFEMTPNVRAAIEREKQIKGWRRSKKITLIEPGIRIGGISARIGRGKIPRRCAPRNDRGPMNRCCAGRIL